VSFFYFSSYLWPRSASISIVITRVPRITPIIKVKYGDKSVIISPVYPIILVTKFSGNVIIVNIIEYQRNNPPVRGLFVYLSALGYKRDNFLYHVESQRNTNGNAD